MFDNLAATSKLVRHVLVAVAGLSLLCHTAAVAVPIGFASLNGGTTGGSGGQTVTATSSQQFRDFAMQNGPLNIQVAGNLDIGGVRISSDKTIIGLGSTAGLVGSLQIYSANNIIIRNLSLSNPNDAGEGDTITLRQSTNVWIDHNNVFDSPDGLLDIVSESDFVTVSWNKFFYTQAYATGVNSNHRFAMLIGNSDNAVEDADNLRVTLHNNYWGDNVRERMPRVRYGEIHAFNNYHNTPGNSYAYRAAVGSELLVENNYFENVNNTIEKFSTGAGVGLIEARNNILINSNAADDGDDDVFDPPYEYPLRDAAVVKALVLAGAGVGFLPGDFNEDGVVNGIDFLAWQRGLSPNLITATDLADWEFNYGTVSPLTVGSSTVPEPGSLLLCFFTLLKAASLRCSYQDGQNLHSNASLDTGYR